MRNTIRNNMLVMAIFFLCSGAAFANQAPKSLFNCLNLDSYTVDQRCTSSLIAENKEFITMQKELSLKVEQHNPNEMAAVQFYPQQMLIKVIAQKKLERKAKLVAALQNSSVAPATMAL